MQIHNWQFNLTAIVNTGGKCYKESSCYYIFSVKRVPFKRGQPSHWFSNKWKLFLSATEVNSQFDLFVFQHIKKYGNTGKGMPLCLSVMVFKECTAHMGSKVFVAIVSEIQEAKYFSVSVVSILRVTQRSVNISYNM